MEKQIKLKLVPAIDDTFSCVGCFFDKIKAHCNKFLTEKCEPEKGKSKIFIIDNDK